MINNTHYRIETRFLNAAFATLVLLYLLIFVGGVVRATKSGMGCPDWPKCYGYIVPPTDKAAVSYNQGRLYEKGQMVILNDTLWVAQQNTNGKGYFDYTVWKKYPKHDFAEFDVAHTWIEYLNRLLGAVTGLFILGVFIASLPFWKSNKLIVLLCFSEFILTGLQGWLGSLVVSSNLSPLKITTHMIVALMIVVILIFTTFLVKKGTKNNVFIVSNKIKYLVFVVIILSLIQIIIGTQVRQEIDLMITSEINYGREHWINNLSGLFFTHKNFAVIVLLINVLLLRQIKRENLNDILPIKHIAILIGMEILVGVILNYFQLPAIMQPVHLVLASMIFGAQFYLLLKVFAKPNVGNI